MPTVTNPRSAIVAMSVGLALTVIATVVPFLGPPAGTLISAHVAAGFPSYTVDEVGTATGTYLAWLAIAGVLGVAAWILSIAAARVASSGHRGSPAPHSSSVPASGCST